MPGPGLCYKRGEVGPPTVHLGPISLHGHRHLSGEGVSFKCSDVSVSKLGGLVSCPSFSSSKDVAAAIGPHGLFRAVSSEGSLPHASSSAAPQRPLVSHVGRSFSLGTSVAAVRRGILVISPGEVGRRRSPADSSSSSSSSSSSVSAHGCLCLAGGAHLDLTVPVVWSREESLLHISVLKMRVVVLDIAAFLPQSSGQSVVLMSDNATVLSGLSSIQLPCSLGTFLAREISWRIS